MTSSLHGSTGSSSCMSRMKGTGWGLPQLEQDTPVHKLHAPTRSLSRTWKTDRTAPRTTTARNSLFTVDNLAHGHRLLLVVQPWPVGRISMIANSRLTSKAPTQALPACGLSVVHTADVELQAETHISHSPRGIEAPSLIHGLLSMSTGTFTCI